LSKRVVSEIMLTLLLIGMLTLAFSIQLELIDAQASDITVDTEKWEVTQTFTSLDTGFQEPSAHGSVFAGYTDPGNVYDGDDGTYAYAAMSADAEEDYYNYGFSTECMQSIDGIEVIVCVAAVDGGSAFKYTYNARLSWDGDNSWASWKATADDIPGDGTWTTKTLGGSNDTWGRTWSPSELSNSNFRVDILGEHSSYTDYSWRIRRCRVKIYYTNPPPHQPSNLLPTDGATGVDLSPTLQCSAFSDPCFGDTHAATQWQITSISGDYSSPIFDNTFISYDTGWRSPSAEGEDYDQWSSFQDVYSSDDQWGSSGMNNGYKNDCYNFSFSFGLSGVSIDGIEVKIEAFRGGPGAGDAKIDVALSWDGGSNYTSQKTTAALEHSPEGFYTLGGPTDTWGRSWSESEISNANFRLRVNANLAFNTAAYIDHIQVKVYYSKNLIQITIPFGTLNCSSTYYWRVRHQDNYDAWSNWSVETSFTTVEEVPVGGIYIPVNKLELLAPYIGLTILLAVAVMTVVYVKKRKRNTKISS